MISAWQNYCEAGDDLDPASPMKRTVRMPSIEDEDVLPLPDGALTTNMGLDLVVVVTKVTNTLAGNTLTLIQLLMRFTID